MLVHNTIHGGIGGPFTRRTGILQGCPLSMMFTALLLRPWALKMQDMDITPRILAYEMFLLAVGRGHLTKFTKGIKHDTYLSTRHERQNLSEQIY